MCVRWSRWAQLLSRHLVFPDHRSTCRIYSRLESREATIRPLLLLIVHTTVIFVTILECFGEFIRVSVTFNARRIRETRQTEREREPLLVESACWFCRASLRGKHDPTQVLIQYRCTMVHRGNKMKALAKRIRSQPQTFTSRCVFCAKTRYCRVMPRVARTYE